MSISVPLLTEYCKPAILVPSDSVNFRCVCPNDSVNFRQDGQPIMLVDKNRSIYLGALKVFYIAIGNLLFQSAILAPK